MRITLLGIDLAKNIFQLHGVDANGKAVLRKKLKREELAVFTMQLPSCTIAMEACGGSHYWSRKFMEQGHTVKLIAAKNVNPFKKSRQKNDSRDAEAITEAASRPNMPLVAPKQLWQQDLQSLHRFRQHFIDHRTATINQCRGLLMEYGVIIKEGASNFFSEMPQILEDGTNELTETIRVIANQLFQKAKTATGEIEQIEQKLEAIAIAQNDYQRLKKVPGVGPMTASMFLASVGSPKVFKNGRHLAAWLGLVPRQSSSGGTDKLLGITKIGDQHLRSILIHGARSVIISCISKQKTDPFSQWVLKLHERKGWNVTAVAIANRNCRVMWHLMNYQEEYKMVL